ncbi:heat shock transcription factor, partial [Trifolium medium]|nr:heat shock transcription factor [Trifolium medium]
EDLSGLIIQRTYNPSGNQSRHASSTSKHWIRPPNGVIKINSDANLSREGRWGLGAACRDSEDRLLAAATWEIPGFDDPATAEACALYYDVRFAVDYCFREVIFESDNRTVITSLNDPSMMPRSYLGNLIWGMLCNKLNFRDCRFQHTGRNANRAAHMLASLAHSEPNKVWLEETHPQLVTILIMDLIH